MNLILLRHGQSTWNLENRFTGWRNVPLTKLGIEEAEYAGKKILENQFNIQSIYTSLLDRATKTSNIVAQIINYPKEEIKNDWRLNERHYGALEGLNKSETAKKYGEDQVKIWRRSFDTPPPQLEVSDKRHPKNNEKLVIWIVNFLLEKA
jgi:2,3-bisphosphoglycerate-dependent phosphoglycerate mutase